MRKAQNHERIERTLTDDQVPKLKAVNNVVHDDGLVRDDLLLVNGVGGEVKVARDLVDIKLGLNPAALDAGLLAEGNLLHLLLIEGDFVPSKIILEVKRYHGALQLGERDIQLDRKRLLVPHLIHKQLRNKLRGHKALNLNHQHHRDEQEARHRHYPQ